MASHVVGSLEKLVTGSTGPPQHTMPHAAGMPGGKVKSGVTDGVVFVARLDVPMIQCRPAPWFGTPPPEMVGGGIVSRTVAVVPAQSNTVRRVLPTIFWKSKSMRISTYCTLGSPATPDMTSLMCARW